MSESYKPGDECPQCGGRIKVANTVRRRDDNQTASRYLACGDCKWRPVNNKFNPPAGYVFPRKNKSQESIAIHSKQGEVK